jgi:hypothetical protein
MSLEGKVTAVIWIFFKRLLIGKVLTGKVVEGFDREGRRRF